MARVTVGTTSTIINTAQGQASAGVGRAVTIKNYITNSGDICIEVGGTSLAVGGSAELTTANGYRLSPGETYSVNLVDENLYAVAGSALTLDVVSSKKG